MNDKTLTALGMNAGEIKIYKALFKLREATPPQLAKATSIRRTTVYSIIQGLAEKGFVIENPTRRPRTFTIAQSTDIDAVLKKDREQLVLREKVLRQFASELSRAAADDSYPVPQVRFIEEKKLEKFLNDQAAWNESLRQTDNTWWGFQDHTYVEQFPHVIDRYWKRAPKETILKLLTNQTLLESEKKLKWKYPRRQIKFWKGGRHFLSSIWIVGEYVMMVNTRRHPYYLVEIRDATLANDLREVFKNLWALV
ncbi:MAG: helix-turn-helix domain-containing protein [Minisyncoccia bacterium]